MPALPANFLSKIALFINYTNAYLGSLFLMIFEKIGQIRKSSFYFSKIIL